VASALVEPCDRGGEMCARSERAGGAKFLLRQCRSALLGGGDSGRSKGKASNNPRIVLDPRLTVQFLFLSFRKVV
jgi:hypothetical protein